MWEVVAEGIFGRPEGWTVATVTNLFSPSSTVEQLGLRSWAFAPPVLLPFAASWNTGMTTIQLQ